MGGPALLTAIELRVDVQVAARLPRQIAIHAEGALTANMTLAADRWLMPTTSELELARLCWQHVGDRTRGAEIRIRSSAPPNAGLASSATTCVAVLRALTSDRPSGSPSRHQLAEAAYHVERDLADRPVGPMDFIPAAFGGTSLVVSEAEAITSVTPLQLPPGARFVIVDTRTPRDTGAVIAWKRRRFAEKEPGIHHYAARMRDLVARQARLLADGASLDELGDSLDEAQTLLCHQLGVSTPLIDTCVARLRAAGALGVKITGTGLGGCLFALTTEPARLAGSLVDLPVGVRLVDPATTGATGSVISPGASSRGARRRGQRTHPHGRHARAES